jgi:hypothetical protein
MFRTSYKTRLPHLLLLSGLFLTAVFFQVASTFAHGTGVSHEESKDGYKIDIGYEEFIAENESVRFDFSLYPENLETVEGEIFTDVWVTFTKDKKIFYAGGVHKPEFGTTGFTFAFAEQGEFIVSARFQKDGETVTKTEFPITVIPPLEEKKREIPYPLAIAGVLGVLMGCGIGFVVGKKVYKSKV